MATRYWIGVTNDLTSIVNWSASEGGAGGASVPGAGDTAIFSRGTTMPTTNLAGIASLLNCYVYQGFGEGAATRTFGTASNAFDCDITGEMVIVNDGLSLVHVAGTIATLMAQQLGGADLKVSAGSVATLRLPETGKFDVATDVPVTTFETAGCGGVLRECPTAPPSLVAYVGRGANVEIQRKLHKAYISGGVKLTESAHTNVAGSEIIVNPGGVLELRQRGGQIGNASSEIVRVMSGGALISKPAVPYTFTASVSKHAGARVEIPAASVAALPTIVPLGAVLV